MFKCQTHCPELDPQRLVGEYRPTLSPPWFHHILGKKWDTILCPVMIGRESEPPGDVSESLNKPRLFHSNFLFPGKVGFSLFWAVAARLFELGKNAKSENAIKYQMEKMRFSVEPHN